MSKTIKNIWKGVLLLTVIGWTILWFKNRETAPTNYVTTTLTRQDLIQTVNETGTVKSRQEAALSFLNTGKIEQIFVSVWDQVKKWDILGNLDNSTLEIQKTEAQAQLEMAQAQLNKLLAGASHSEIAVATSNVTQAQTAYSKAQQELSKIQNTVRENNLQAQHRLADLTWTGTKQITPEEQAVLSAETSLNNIKTTYQQKIETSLTNALNSIKTNLPVNRFALDIVNRILDEDDDKNYLSVKNSTYLQEANNLYHIASSLHSDNKITFDTLDKNDTAALNTSLNQTLESFNKTFLLLNSTFSVLENSITTVEYTQVDLNTDKNSLNTQIVSLSNAILNIQTNQQALKDSLLTYQASVDNATESFKQAQVNLENAILNAQNAVKTAEVSGKQQIMSAESHVANTQAALEVAQKQLDQVKAGTRSEDIALQKAQIKQAQSLIQDIENQIEKNAITAPFNGTITKVEYKNGEISTLGKSAFYLLEENQMEIEVDISESDITKIKLDNKAEITFDALWEENKFYGKVSQIEPAETIIQEVIYYKITLTFDNPELIMQKAIKPGMTANVTITTAEKKNVLTVPSRAIIDRNGDGKFLKLLINNQAEERKIETGLQGDEGMTEIISGVKEGEEVITYTKT